MQSSLSSLSLSGQEYGPSWSAQSSPRTITVTTGLPSDQLTGAQSPTGAVAPSGDETESARVEC
jgi:hypothetical protein